MTKPELEARLFKASSLLTDHFPRAGARLLDGAVRSVVGNPLVAGAYARRNQKIVRSVGAFRSFLVIADTHLGDAVMAQSSLTALRDFFPDARIDYVVNKTAASLIDGNPDVSTMLPIFSGGIFPSRDNVDALHEITRAGSYDLCINFSPFIEDEDIAQPGQRILRFMSHTAQLLRNENDPEAINHFIYQGYAFVRNLLMTVAPPVRNDAFRGVRTTYSDRAIEDARSFVRDCGIVPGRPVILYNPDTAGRFTLMPFETQVALLARLAELDATILMGVGLTEAGIGHRLRDTLGENHRQKVRMIPAGMALDTYGALIDSADVFITGDTGPLHIGASRKSSRTGQRAFRNHTAILSFFGATTPRMSGYDSTQHGYLAANQDAPSWCYQAESPCRNISCLNKMLKTCRSVRCFDRVDVGKLAGLVGAHLQQAANRAS
jgi:ADP-heptose:LPS heptosyltransferase